MQRRILERMEEAVQPLAASMMSSRRLAFDGVGAATLVVTLKGLAIGGTAVVIGQGSGPAPAIEPSLLTPSATRLAGGSIFTSDKDSAELQSRAALVIDAIRAGWLRLTSIHSSSEMQRGRLAPLH